MSHDLLRVSMPIAVLGVLTLLGYAATVCLDRNRWEFLTPALPAVGLLVAVVALHWTSLLFGTNVGVWIVLGGAAVNLAVAGWRNPARLRIRRQALRSLAVALALGVPTLIIAAQPAFGLDDASVVHPSGNHDSFFYVSDSSWLQDHRATERPHLGSGPSTSVDVPADQPAIATVDFGFRLGEPLVQAAVSSVSGRPLASIWYEVSTGWLALLPGAAMALASCLRLRRWMGALAGLGASLSTLALFQVLNQNDPSVMAVAVVPLVLAAVFRASDPKHQWNRENAVVAAIALAGFLGLYPEMSTLIGLSILALLLTARRGLRKDALHVVAIGLGVIVTSPLAVYNAVRLLRTLSTLTPEWPRKSFTQSVPLALARAVGVTGFNESTRHDMLAITVLAILAIGLISALLVPRLRVLVAFVIMSGVIAFASKYRLGDDYSLERLVMVGQPVIILCSFIGLAALAGRGLQWNHNQSAGRILSCTAIGVSLTALCSVVIGAQVATQLRITPPREALAAVSVRPQVVQAIQWAKQLGGTDGREVSVVTDDYVDRLWLSDGLRHEADVAYPVLTSDYFGVDSFTDGHLTRFLITSRNMFTDAPPQAIIRSNSLYVAYDLQGLVAWFALPLQGSYAFERGPSGSAATWVTQSVSLLTMRTTAAAQISLRTSTNPNVGGVELMISDGVSGRADVLVPAAPAEVAIPVPSTALITTVQITANKSAKELPGGDQRRAVFTFGGHVAGG